jgi:6-phosphogluconolactonase
MFSILSTLPLDWVRVTIGLVDERWVGPEDPASNEKLVRSCLLKGPAATSGFLPLREPGVSAEEAAATRAVAYAPHCDPPSFVLLGMGLDGHTASWFPGSVSLGALLAPSGADVIAFSDAAGCPVAGDYPVRLTLTRPAVARAEAAALLIFGEDKLSVIEAALNAPPEAYPIRAALDDLADRLSIFWAP